MRIVKCVCVLGPGAASRGHFTFKAAGAFLGTAAGKAVALSIARADRGERGTPYSIPAFTNICLASGVAR
jgi:hypothetical protein